MGSDFARMCLIGCGLIGGSISLALRRAGVVDSVIGVDVSQATLGEAVRRGIIDQGTLDLGDALLGADLVLIAAPVSVTEALIADVARHQDALANEAIVTDVSGTKQRFVARGQHLFTRVHFIGGHPMAGSEKTGVTAADARLLENAVYVLAPPAELTPAQSAALGRLSEGLTRAGARVRLMSAGAHDRVVAAISHVPHLIAAALVNQVADLSTSDEAYLQLAAGGFRDITRIASSDPLLWRDITLENREEILRLIADWDERLHLLASWMDTGDGAALEQFFESARAFRDLLPARSVGALRSTFSITVSVPDVPGVIGDVASLLGGHQVSIRNIGILESREGDDGQLLLQFDTLAFHDQAAAILEDHGYAIADRM